MNTTSQLCADTQARPHSQTGQESLATLSAQLQMWQITIDPSMIITSVHPPVEGENHEGAFERDIIGRDFLTALEVDLRSYSAKQFGSLIRARADVRNLRLDKWDSNRSTLTVNAFPIRETDDTFSGYRCTVIDPDRPVLRNRPVNQYEAVLAAFVGHVPNMVVVKDIEGRYITLNPLAERIYGLAQADMLGHRAEDVLPADLVDECVRGDSLVLECEAPVEIEQTFQWADGPHTFSTVKFPVFDADHCLVGIGAIGIDITQQKAVEDGLYRHANLDPVTGLPNRRLVLDRFQQAAAIAQRASTGVGVLLLDLGDFTAYNESRGHVAGDQLLVHAGERIRSVCREADTVGRISGDLFSIILPNIAKREEMETVARKILASLKTQTHDEMRDSFVQPSIGMALFPHDSEHAEDLLRCAKLALDRAKQQGRGSFQYFSSELTGPFLRRLAIENKLRGALQRGELHLAYQPIVETERGDVVGAEALLRWTNSELGSVRPGEFIPIAEDAGLIKDIGAWVMATACDDIMLLNPPGAPRVTISVNVSVKQLSDEHILDVVAACLKSSQIDPSLLKIEITESAFADNVQLVRHVVDGLRALGVLVSLDDFGTGYSSLAYLHQFSFSQLKIDKTFVDGLVERGDGFVLVDGIIRMAHALRLEIVAEGVETAEQRGILAELGCDKCQGYHFGKPVPLSEFQLARLQTQFHLVA
jgi:diguanylate cyclase (GGDEF)-like protein/PAS domain S-box-containing protein